MADSPWLILRQAREALDHHRPEEAHRLIEPLIAEGYRRAWRLAREVVKEYIARATKELDQHRTDAAWRDLLAAESLNTGEKGLVEFRQTLGRLGLVQSRALLEAGYPLETIAAVGKLRDRGVRHPDLAALESSARAWARAAELADGGEFLRALEEMDGFRPTLPCPATGFDRFRGTVEDRYNRFRAAVAHLYDAAEARQWRDALAASDAVLAVAPEHREAKALRGKAWMAASPDTADYIAVVEGNGAAEQGRENLVASTRRDTGRPSPPPIAGLHALRATFLVGARDAQALLALGGWRRRLPRLLVEPRDLRAGDGRSANRCAALRRCFAPARRNHSRRRGIRRGVEQVGAGER
jgi:hypothetical protein